MRAFFVSLILILLQTHADANPWVKKSNFGGVGRHRAVGIAIANRGYMGLGHVNGTGMDISYKDWWAYDPASDTWTQKANFPVNNHGAVSFATDTRGYVGGGSALTNEFYEYNPVTNTWNPIAPCLLSPGDTQGFSVQNKGYVYQANQLVEYDPSINSWQLKTSAPVAFGTWSCSFATESSGFIKSGINLYEYKPSNDTWIQRASFPGAMSNGSSAFCKDGKGYVTCGYSGGLSVVTDEVWEFNPGNNSWTYICEFPGTSRRFPVAFTVNDKGYFGTGTNGINLNDFWQFDFDPLATNELTQMTSTVNIFPIPADDEITVTIQNDMVGDWKLEIIRLTGEIEKECILSEKTTNIKGLNSLSGIYFYTVKNEERTIKNGKLYFK
jgi:N-acetylneuraminic acid mutarotase